MEYAIELEGIYKNIEGREILRNVSMKIKKGSIYGFLGPNGSGKTTVMKIILNLLKPDAGGIKILGERVGSESYNYLKSIGSIIEYPVFYESSTASENLKLHCQYMGYYNLNKIDELLELVGLAHADNKKVSGFSLGMRQRLGIARALITNPEILILDEPINGLDPIGIKEIRELLLKVNSETGTTIFISSHILSEIDSISDTVAFIKNGMILKEIEMKEIEQASLKFIEVTVNQIEKAAAILDGELQIDNFKILDENKIRIYNTDIHEAEISKLLVMNGIQMQAIEKKKINLEEYFMTLMSEGEKR